MVLRVVGPHYMMVTGLRAVCHHLGGDVVDAGAVCGPIVKVEGGGDR